MARAYKTTQRKRESSANTRKGRVAIGKPQPNMVDEAISAAAKSHLRRLKAEGDKPVLPSAVLDTLLDVAINHLVDIRGLNRDQSRIALTARLLKRRRYKSVRPSES
ncbi:hypothetical protein AWN88_22675 [Agrobacterium tumefaciens]|nr:hypothetical protein AWN88_22675 [Agrobacterium tumefaciens]KAJ35070.1 hypothetical protein BW45_00050 [Agrobacterium tumefaciens]